MIELIDNCLSKGREISTSYEKADFYIFAVKSYSIISKVRKYFVRFGFNLKNLITLFTEYE